MAEEVRARPDYGLDAPGVVIGNVRLGVIALVIGGAAFFLLRGPRPDLAFSLGSIGATYGLIMLVVSGIMAWGSRVGKLRAADRLLASMPWRGSETVLDVGCGRGLLTTRVAKRLTTGKVIGIDIWRGEDESGNSAEATWANARAEGVADRIEIRDADARRLPFPDRSFDAVVSSWVLHNIEDADGRAAALREITRVLRPGGSVGILDIEHTAEYVQALRAMGFTELTRSRPDFLFIIPTYAIIGRKVTRD
jgi:arsenite methyltransferase